jgi:CheY-like chemotaxis protein
MVPASNKFVLIGEDDKDDQEMLRDVFTAVDPSFQLVFVDTGKQLINLLGRLGNDLPCLIILDYNMPELNGADILEQLNALNAYEQIPKVIWSTSGSEKFKNRCLELGAIEYIIKPSSFSALEDVARRLIDVCSGKIVKP